MLSNLTGWHSLIILAIVVLLFGTAKFPALARSLGQSAKILRNEMKSDPPEADPVGPDAMSSGDFPGSRSPR